MKLYKLNAPAYIIFSVNERIMMVVIKQSIVVLSVEKQQEGSSITGIRLKQQIYFRCSN